MIEKAYEGRIVVTPLGRMTGSKMSGEELSLRACSHKIRPKNFRRTKLTKQSNRVSFLYSNSR